MSQIVKRIGESFEQCQKVATLNKQNETSLQTDQTKLEPVTNEQPNSDRTSSCSNNESTTKEPTTEQVDLYNEIKINLNAEKTIKSIDSKLDSLTEKIILMEKQIQILLNDHCNKCTSTDQATTNQTNLSNGNSPESPDSPSFNNSCLLFNDLFREK